MVFLWNLRNVLMRMCRKKEKGPILYITGRVDQITTSAKLHDITHETYAFSIDLIQVINL